MSSLPPPAIWIENCQTARAIDLAQLEERAEPAFKEVLKRTDWIASGGAAEMVELEVSLVSEEEICRIHQEFLNDPSPTDVITFEHGEIIIGVEAAVMEAQARGWPLERELLLYLIHGFLHLQGLDDHQPKEAERMRILQEEILDLHWPLEGDCA